MLQAVSCLVGLLAVARAALIPEMRYSLPARQDSSHQGSPRQLLFLQNPENLQFHPQLPHGFELVENPNAQYITSHDQKRESSAEHVEKSPKSSAAGQAGKLETLEPDAEVIPGGEQNSNQKPPTQVPVLPQIPGLLPGQMIYIIHPQHQIYTQNPGYSPLPNGYRPNIQFPGYQRFYIVAPQGNEIVYSQQNAAGYQPQYVVDPSLGPIYSSPGLQSIYQRLAGFAPQPASQGLEKQQPAPGQVQLEQQQQQRQPQQSAAGAGGPPLTQGRPLAPSEFVGLPQFAPGLDTGAPINLQFANHPALQQQLLPFPGLFNGAEFNGARGAGPAPAAGSNPEAQGRNDDYNYDEASNETSSESTDEATNKTDQPEIPPEPKAGIQKTEDNQAKSDDKNIDSSEKKSTETM